MKISGYILKFGEEFTSGIVIDKDCKVNISKILQSRPFGIIDTDCKITTLEPNCVYTFGNTLHTFYNGSNTKRINLVFEIVD